MLSVINLTKKFGDFTAVDNLNFKVERGEIFGLLGENGAGKTTTLRMLATMLKPTSGTAVMGKYDINNEPEKVRETIGILFGGESGLYDRLTAAENISYFAELNDMDRKSIKERIDFLAKSFGMEEYLNKRASKLSKGMKQKVAFARAIVHNPDIMLFDEPTSGLDVGAIRNVHDFILDCKKQGKTVVFSSHSMSEVEKLCDKVGIIHKGKLKDTGSIDELKRKYENDSLEEIFMRLVGDMNEG
ncbi:MAG TPA: ATP-binding cassette domain-containing protein [Clostridiaceae bacterium]|nr:ATP-binding cassette domain-containing protein [Clostridiaceae bacterium]